MNTESAILMAIVLAFTLHLQATRPTDPSGQVPVTFQSYPAPCIAADLLVPCIELSLLPTAGD